MLLLLFALLELVFLLFVWIYRVIDDSAEEKRKNIVRAEAVAAFTGKPKEFFDTAKKMIEVNEPKMALAAIRNSLEALVMLIADEDGVIFRPDDTLYDMIDYLDYIGILHAEQTSLMHRIRMSCNKGSHVELYERDVTEDEAVNALRLMEQLIATVRKYQARTMSQFFDEENDCIAKPI